MKLWVQILSSETKMKDFIALFQKGCQAAASPGTVVEVRGTQNGALGTQYAFFRHYEARDVISHALNIRANGGYDAFLMANAYEACMPELREILDIPVLSITEVACFTACQMGGSFSIIAPNHKSIPRYRQLVEGYGVGSRLASIESVTLPHYGKMVSNISRGDPNTEVFDELYGLIDKCLEDGAEVIIPFGPPAALLCDQRIYEYKGVPILDVNSLIVKAGEMAVGMHRLTGHWTSRRLTYQSPPVELLRETCALRQIPNLTPDPPAKP